MKSIVLFSSGITSLLLLCGCTAPEFHGASPVMMEGCAAADDAAPAVESVAFMPAPQAKSMSANRAGAAFRPVENRKMAFTASLAINVDDPAEAVSAAEKLAGEVGGYVQEVDNFRLTLKVPTARGDEVLSAVEKFGTVTNRIISGVDVTDQVTDLEIRLDNLRKLRARLLILLGKAEKVEDTLSIETELARITTELEQLEAAQKNLVNRIDYVSLTIRFNQRATPITMRDRIPVNWVAMIGDTEWRNQLEPNGKNDLPFDVELPPGFAILRSEPGTLWAVAADESVIRLSVRPSLEGADLAFWNELILRGLDGNSYSAAKSETIRLPEKLDALKISAERPVGTHGFHYQLLLTEYRGLFESGGKLYLIECWTPASRREQLAPQLDRMYDSVDLVWWR